MQSGRSPMSPSRIPHPAPRLLMMTGALLLAAVLMIGFGIWRGEADTVLAKAIRLCMECVGIG